MYPKTVSITRVNWQIWLQSNFTGEIVRPWDLPALFSMIADMFVY